MVICMQSVRIFSQERKHLSTMEHFLLWFSSHFLSFPNLFKIVLPSWFKYCISQGQKRNLGEFVNDILNIRRSMNEGKGQLINCKEQLIPSPQSRSLPIKNTYLNSITIPNLKRRQNILVLLLFN